jgi:hypothetical protein
VALWLGAASSLQAANNAVRRDIAVNNFSDLSGGSIVVVSRCDLNIELLFVRQTMMGQSEIWAMI